MGWHTTDGSQRYPAPPPLREVFGEVPQQICECHGVKEIVTAVCSAGASERKGVAAKQPPLPKGRPSTKATKKAARKKKNDPSKG